MSRCCFICLKGEGEIVKLRNSMEKRIEKIKLDMLLKCSMSKKKY